MLDRAISTKFLTCVASVHDIAIPVFQQIFVSPKMMAILNFQIFRKIAIHKNAYIVKTMLNRTILMKFLTCSMAG